MSSSLKIAVSTKILPRIETFFLEEWIEHYLMLGVSKIFILVDDSKTPSRSRRYDHDNDLNTAVWQKKPNADYFFDHTDHTIHQHLWGLQEVFGDRVYLHRKSFLPRFYKRSGSRQFMYHNRMYRDFDWWLRCDPDEYLHLGDFDLHSFLESYKDNDIGCFLFSQRVFDKRIRDVPVRSVLNWGYDLPLPKSLIIKDVEVYHEHYSKPSKGSVFKVPAREAKMHHYRGPASDVKNLSKVHKPYEDAVFDKIDTSMDRYL